MHVIRTSSQKEVLIQTKAGKAGKKYKKELLEWNSYEKGGEWFRNSPPLPSHLFPGTPSRTRRNSSMTNYLISPFRSRFFLSSSSSSSLSTLSHSLQRRNQRKFGTRGRNCIDGSIRTEYPPHVRRLSAYRPSASHQLSTSSDRNPQNTLAILLT